MYDKFLKRLKEIREYEWNQYDIKIYQEFESQRGVRDGETALEAIARHMVEVLEDSQEPLKQELPTPLEWEAQVMYEHKGFGTQIISISKVLGCTPDEAREAARKEFETNMSDYVDEETVLKWDVRIRPAQK